MLRGRQISWPNRRLDGPQPMEEQNRGTIRALAEFLGGRDFRPAAPARPTTPPEWQAAEAWLRRRIASPVRGPDTQNGDTLHMSLSQRTALASAIVQPDEARLTVDPSDPLYLPGLFNFIGQLRRYRHCLAQELTSLHRQSNLEPLLLTPAMVDFGRWLGTDPAPGSSFAEQVEVWSEISARPDGPAIHGYVAFCPLRQVLFERSGLPPSEKGESPLDLVERALRTRGFLGVKVYPPMGFRAWDNESRSAPVDPPYAVDVLERVFGQVDPQPEDQLRELGRLLDEALKSLYALCGSADLRAPIMAHAKNSNGAARRAGELADPYFWRGVFDWAGPGVPGYSPPPVMLAHLGGFADQSRDPAPGPPVPAPAPAPAPAPEKVEFNSTWEASLARYLRDNGCAPVFADISFLRQAQSSDVAGLVANLRALKGLCPAIEDHLVFGTDWVMLAQQRGVPDYGTEVRKILVEVFGADGSDKIMRRNFLRYSGLIGPIQARTVSRLSEVYRGDPLLIERLTRVCEGVTVGSCQAQ